MERVDSAKTSGEVLPSGLERVDSAQMSTESLSSDSNSEVEEGFMFKDEMRVAIIAFASENISVQLHHFELGSMGRAITVGDHSQSADGTEESRIICKLPWGGIVTYSGYMGNLHVNLPPFSTLVGFSKSTDALDLTGTDVHSIPYSDERPVLIEGRSHNSITHIAVRNCVKGKYDGLIALRVGMVGGNRTYGQVCESGPAIKRGLNIVRVSKLKNNGNNSTLATSSVPDIVLVSPDHRIVYAEELVRSTVHPISRVPDSSELGSVNSRSHHYYSFEGLELENWLLPWVLGAVGLLLWILPGLIEWLGGERNWASILNECIGTGSVLLGVVTYITRRSFSYIGLRDIARGKIKIRNDLVARILARRDVRKLERSCCDPRIPTALIASDENGCVRVHRSGWLRVGKRIKVQDLHLHNYYLLKDEGVILDLLEARIFKLLQVRSGVERILRRGEEDLEWTAHSVSDDSVII